MLGQTIRLQLGSPDQSLNNVNISDLSFLTMEIISFSYIIHTFHFLKCWFCCLTNLYWELKHKTASCRDIDSRYVFRPAYLLCKSNQFTLLLWQGRGKCQKIKHNYINSKPANSSWDRTRTSSTKENYVNSLTFQSPQISYDIVSTYRN